MFEGKGWIHFDSYMCTLDKPTASMPAAISAVAMAMLFNLDKGADSVFLEDSI